MPRIARVETITNNKSTQTLTISKVANTVEISIAEEADDSPDCATERTQASIILTKTKFLELLETIRISDEVFRL